MRHLIRKLRALGSFGLAWAVGFAAFAGVAMLAISVADPSSIDADQSPFAIAAAMGFVGLVSGVAFGAVLGFAEKRKKILELSVMRVAAWGAIGAAALPLLTGMQDKLAIITSPLGALFAAGTVAAVKRLERRDMERLETPRLSSNQLSS